MRRNQYLGVTPEQLAFAPRDDALAADKRGSTILAQKPHLAGLDIFFRSNEGFP